MGQPYGIEVEQFIIAGDRPEHDLRKRRRGGGFAGEANAQSDRHKIHQCLAADIKRLHTGIVSSLRESRCDPFTQLVSTDWRTMKCSLRRSAHPSSFRAVKT